MKIRCMLLFVIWLTSAVYGVEYQLKFNKEKSDKTLVVEIWREDTFIKEQEIVGFAAAYLVIKCYLKHGEPKISYGVITGKNPSIILWVIRRQQGGSIGLVKYDHHVTSVDLETQDTYLKCRNLLLKNLKLETILSNNDKIKYFLKTEETPTRGKDKKTYVHDYIAIDVWKRSVVNN